MKRQLFVTAAALALLAGCATTQSPVSVADTLARTPELSTMHALVVKAGLNDTLMAGNYTVFAPTNDAFKAVPAKTMDELAHDPAKLKAVLAYHMLPTKVATTSVHNGKAKSVNGADLNLARAGDFVIVEEAMVQKGDMAATNGVVHSIDRVLMPPRR